MMIDKEAKGNIIKLLSKNIRQDQRKFDEFREIEIELGIVEMAEGSARVKVGDTEVIAGVKLKLDKPYSDTPDEGVLMVNSELSPMSNPRFEFGPPSIESIEVSRVIDRGIREGHAMDSKGLCVEAGEKVWIVNVDINPINHDGNLIDIGGIAALAALYNARFPEIEDGKANYKRKSDKHLPIIEEPLPVTVFKIGESLIIDPTENEESVADARLTVTFRKDGNLCAMQKGGDASLTTDEIKNMIDIAEKVAAKNRAILEKAVKQ